MMLTRLIFFTLLAAVLWAIAFWAGAQNTRFHNTWFFLLKLTFWLAASGSSVLSLAALFDLMLRP